MVVAYPGEIVGELFGPGRALRGGTEQPDQLLGPARRVRLLAHHQPQPVGQRLRTAGEPVVRGGGRRVELTGPLGLGRHHPVVTSGGEVLEQRFHHVPGRHLCAVEAGAQTIGVTVAEDSVPAAFRIEERRQVP